MYGEHWDRFVRVCNMDSGRPAMDGGKKPLIYSSRFVWCISCTRKKVGIQQ